MTMRGPGGRRSDADLRPCAAECAAMQKHERKCYPFCGWTFSLNQSGKEFLKLDRFYGEGFCLPLGKRTYTMGILNVTPDSFSDGGKWFNPDAAAAHAA